MVCNHSWFTNDVDTWREWKHIVELHPLSMHEWPFHYFHSAVCCTFRADNITPEKTGNYLSVRLLEI